MSPSAEDEMMVLDEDAHDASTAAAGKTGTRKKRSNSASDGAGYPRRRAAVACQVCRLRKTKCDGARPKCRLCVDLDAECIYREPGVKLDAGDKLILRHLSRIEDLIRSSLPGQASSITAAAAATAATATATTAAAVGQRRLSSTSPTASQDAYGSGEDLVGKPYGAGPGKMMAGLGSWSNPPPGSISTMPKMHTTPALNLLHWPLIRDLVSKPYDPQILLQLEMAREPLRLVPFADLDLTNATIYIRAFFERANVWYACVNPYTWSRYYATALECGFRECPESCAVLLVLALGEASHHGSISFVPADQDPLGLAYFSAAYSMLPSIGMRNSVIATQCLILASAYLLYLVRPLEAWNVLSSLSMKLQLLFGCPSRVPGRWKELSVRLYWNALLYESDLLAELDLPHSGIFQLEELIDLPGGFDEEEELDDDDDDDDEGAGNDTIAEDLAGQDELWYFLAEIALRRLLNRVSHMIYQKDSPLPLSTLGPIVAELDLQLTQWHDSLPQPVKFPLDHMPLGNAVQTVLRLRFFACRTIIYRPYILAALENEQVLGVDPTIREYCRRCLEATLRQLEHITSHREGHLPYLWQGALSMVSQSLLVMGVTLSAALSALLPPAHQVDAILASVVAEVERYAHLAPSLRLAAEIIRDAERRRQLCLRTFDMRI